MIGELVARLIEAGTSPEVAAMVVTEAFAAGAAAASTGFRRQTGDDTGDRRREWDRNRKRDQRSLRLPESEWLPLVAAVLKRDGGKCTYCGATEKLTADHVVPLTRGGSNETSNLTACCIPCNTKKSNKLVSEWLPAVSTVFHPTVYPNPQNAENASISKELKKDSKRQNRGSRVDTAWAPSADERAFAKQEGFSDYEIDREAQKFRDYWTACAGAKGVKLDWSATWRQWIRNSADRSGKRPARVVDLKAAGFYAMPDSLQIEAWDRYNREKDGKSLPRDRDGGWRVPSEWPPGYVPTSEPQIPESAHG